jgi:hypothetical protein
MDTGKRDALEPAREWRDQATPDLLRLVRADLISAQAGPGGYRLTRTPSEVTLLEVVQARRAQLWPPLCTLIGGPCRGAEVCACHSSWSCATTAVRDDLADTTLAEVADTDRAINSGSFPDPEDSHRRPQSRGGNRGVAVLAADDPTSRSAPYRGLKPSQAPTSSALARRASPACLLSWESHWTAKKQPCGTGEVQPGPRPE